MFAVYCILTAQQIERWTVFSAYLFPISSVSSAAVLLNPCLNGVEISPNEIVLPYYLK